MHIGDCVSLLVEPAPMLKNGHVYLANCILIIGGPTKLYTLLRVVRNGIFFDVGLSGDPLDPPKLPPPPLDLPGGRSLAIPG